jgi:hypothetical protein
MNHVEAVRKTRGKLLAKGDGGAGKNTSAYFDLQQHNKSLITLVHISEEALV